MIEQISLNNALLKGAQEVFTTMISRNIESCDSCQEIEGDSFLGSITFNGGLEGCLAICCSERCAKTIAANMLAMDSDEELSEEEICDPFGEVAHMIMDSVKSRLQKTTGEITTSIPMVVRGRELQNSIGEGAYKTLIKVKLESEYLAELSILCRDITK